MTLIGYWPLNEQTGTKAYDHSGNENHGTINDGGDSTIPGNNGILNQNAYQFDGNNDYVDLGGQIIPGSSPYTVSAWVYMDTSSGNNDIYIDGGGRMYLRYQEGTGYVHSIYDGSDRYYAEWSGPTNEWVHLAAVWKNNNIILYANGEKKATAGSTSYPNLEYNSASIGYNVRTGNYPLSGRISEVRVYNRHLTSLEIQYLHSVSQKGRTTSSIKKI